MASKTAQEAPGQSDFFRHPTRSFCSFLGSLFAHFLTKFWTTFGCLFGCLLGAFSGLLRFSWEASGSKNIKKLMVFQGFWQCSFLVLWSSWWPSWAHFFFCADFGQNWWSKKGSKTDVQTDFYLLQTPCQKNPPLKNPLKINKSPKKSLWPGPFGEMGPSKKGYFEDAFKIA